MATAMHVAARGGEIKLEYGAPEIFALKFVAGKNIEGRYGPRVLFTASDDRKLFLDAEDGSDLERGMRELGIQPGEQVKVTKIRGVRGGGHSIRVEHAPADSSYHQDYSRDLERSIEMARETRDARQPGAYVPAPAAAPEKPTSGTHPTDRQPLNSSPAMAPAGVKMCAAMCAAVDAILETQVYATRRGLGLTFSEESVRAIGLSIYIGQQRGAQ